MELSDRAVGLTARYDGWGLYGFQMINRAELKEKIYQEKVKEAVEKGLPIPEKVIEEEVEVVVPVVVVPVVVVPVVVVEVEPEVIIEEEPKRSGAMGTVVLTLVVLGICGCGVLYIVLLAQQKKQ